MAAKTLAAVFGVSRGKSGSSGLAFVFEGRQRIWRSESKYEAGQHVETVRRTPPRLLGDDDAKDEVEDICEDLARDEFDHERD